MQIKKLILGSLMTNTYVVTSAGKSVVIDPAGGSRDDADDSSAKRIFEEATSDGAELVAILLTHGHHDHVSACAALRELSGAKVFVHEKDAVMLHDIHKSYASMIPEVFTAHEADVLFKSGEVNAVTVGDVVLNVMETPGHTGGSVVYVADSVIFSGDTLFESGVGRTDAWSGSSTAQRESLAKIGALTGEYRVLPGHGRETTLEREKQSNPLLWAKESGGVNG
jgi:glyoxylase-like metal-dependent hydrolase (beta-lactamase superfamily II)